MRLQWSLRACPDRARRARERIPLTAMPLTSKTHHPPKVCVAKQTHFPTSPKGKADSCMCLNQASLSALLYMQSHLERSLLTSPPFTQGVLLVITCSIHQHLTVSIFCDITHYPSRFTHSPLIRLPQDTLTIRLRNGILSLN